MASHSHRSCYKNAALHLLLFYLVTTELACPLLSRSLMKANVLTLKKSEKTAKPFPLTSLFFCVPRWTNAVRCSWKSVLFSTFLSEATLSLFWVEFATMLSGKDQVVLHWSDSADCTDKEQEKAERGGRGEEKMRVHFWGSCEVRLLHSCVFSATQVSSLMRAEFEGDWLIA